MSYGYTIYQNQKGEILGLQAPDGKFDEFGVTTITEAEFKKIQREADQEADQ